MENARSRRDLLLTGAAGVLSVVALAPTAQADHKGDLGILQAAYDLESQAIWAYGVAGSKLSSSSTAKVILALALRNQADHKAHQSILGKTIRSLEGTPPTPKDSYDLSSYLTAGEGGLDSDVNIAKLALALEVDAALTYQAAVGKFKTPEIAAAANSIMPVELSHAAAIRAVFHSLIPSIESVPASFLNPTTRKDWVLKV